MKDKIENNPLKDKKWLKEFAEGLKKDLQQSTQKKASSHGWISEIVCTQEDIGEPHSQNKKGVKK